MDRLRNILGVSALVLSSTRAAPALTFHKDIEPILQSRCQTCHRVGETAPMPLVTYEEVRPWAKAIRTAVLSGKMPPWHADPHYGKFLNDLSLPAEEKEKLIAWIDSGAREGDPADSPKPRDFPSGWKIPKPDVVFEMPTEFQVPAKGELDYQYISVPTHFTEDKWVQMAEVRPSDPSVVHHAIVVVENDRSYQEEYLAGYAPGMTPQIWKPGQARLVKAGSTLVFQMHYTTKGTPAKDRTRIGLVFSKKPVTEQIVAMEAMGLGLRIPPGDPHYRVDAVAFMPRDVLLMGMRAHMHLRGRSFSFRAVYPNGQTEILLDIPRYDFNWQPYYYLETPKFLPRGTRIECTAIFDNSANNPFNPDPDATITWGPQSRDEMMIGWLDVAVPLQGAGAWGALRGSTQ
jgi:hypothetical protein